MYQQAVVYDLYSILVQPWLRSKAWAREKRGYPLAVLSLFAILMCPSLACAQAITNGWVVFVYGVVQVEPGDDVSTLQVKDEQIRFAIRNVRCSDRNFSTGRFMTDVTSRKPGLFMKGPEPWLDMLINERPGKRVLQLTGVYYPESRNFVLSNVQRFQESAVPR